MKRTGLPRSDLDVGLDEGQVSELFAHLFTALVLASTVAFVVAGVIVMCL